MAAGLIRLGRADIKRNLTRGQALEVLKKIKARREAQAQAQAQTSHGKKSRAAKRQAKKSSSTGRKKRTTHGISDPDYVEEITSEPAPPSKNKINYKGPYRYILKEKARKRKKQGKPIKDMEEFVRKYALKHAILTPHLQMKEKDAKKRRQARKLEKALRKIQESPNDFQRAIALSALAARYKKRKNKK